MDLYHIWCDLKPGVDDLDFANRLDTFLSHLKRDGSIADWRLTRCKLGLRPDAFPEWHIMIETEDLAQLDHAFKDLSAHEGESDRVHFAANALVTNVKFGLFRDFPDR